MWLLGASISMPKPVCPTPKKRRMSEAKAIHSAISLSNRVGYSIRAYQCVCGSWHLTRWAYNTKQEHIGRVS